jgi:hypothetical protein
MTTWTHTISKNLPLFPGMVIEIDGKPILKVLEYDPERGDLRYESVNYHVIMVTGIEQLIIDNILNEVMIEKGMIEMVKVFALEQTYDDGRPNEIWHIGDKTKNGIIVDFAKSTGDYWIAITDTPSEWQKQQGQKNGWSWIFQLERI